VLCASIHEPGPAMAGVHAPRRDDGRAGIIPSTRSSCVLFVANRWIMSCFSDFGGAPRPRSSMTSLLLDESNPFRSAGIAIAEPAVFQDPWRSSDPPGPMIRFSGWLSSGCRRPPGCPAAGALVMLSLKPALQAPWSGNASHQDASRAQLTVFATPSVNDVLGDQPRTSRALALSGTRRGMSS
jgi:hypothetical protein